jgi:signal transduction histidine kinase
VGRVGVSPIEESTLKPRCQGVRTLVFSSGKRLFLLVGFLAAFVVVLNVSTFVLYDRAKSHLDNELGERLRAIATTLSRAVELSSPDGVSVEGVDASLLMMLHLVRSENSLSNIVILTPEGRTLVDLAEYSERGEMNPFIELDYSAVALARAGIPAYTSLYRSGGIYLKSAYAPVVSVDERVSGIVGVEAGAGFFTVLRALTKAIIVIDAASAVIVLVLAVFFYRESRSLDRAHAAVLRGENLATMGRMVAGIAHEIRNPLSIIKTSAERLAKKYDSDDEIFSYISEEVDDLNSILTAYLNFARAEKADFRPHPIQRIVRRCLQILDGEIQSKRINLVQDLPKEEIMVHGDDKRLQQALLNVLINACQAVDERGTIEVSVKPSAKFAYITIKDNGTGIGERQLKEVLKPFYTTKRHGSGLGLTIADDTVKEHNGSLDIKSAPGSGTEVVMSLPRAPAG